MLLEVKDLCVAYGKIEALHGISLAVNQGEIVALLGANGAGKTTTLNAVSGLVGVTGGAILLAGRPIHNLKAHEITRSGVTQAPEGRRIFGTLTVAENLNLGAYAAIDRRGIEQTRSWVYELFPVLAERQRQLAGTLSGGEQQMLTIGRALMSSPKLLLLDEPSLGLGPKLVKTIFATIRTIHQAGVSIVLVEQNVRLALTLAQRGYVLETGRIVLEDRAEGLLANPDVRKAYLGGRLPRR